ncbi:hypothetical protein GCM10027072_45490 [Streptomyces bullii]
MLREVFAGERGALHPTHARAGAAGATVAARRPAYRYAGPPVMLAPRWPDTQHAGGGRSARGTRDGDAAKVRGLPFVWMTANADGLANALAAKAGSPLLGKSWLSTAD